VVPFGITDWAARGTPGQILDPAYTCTSVPNKDLSNSGAWNSAHWCNPQFDSLVKQFEASVDQTERRSLAVQAAKIQQEQVPDVIGKAFVHAGERLIAHELPVGVLYASTRELVLRAGVIDQPQDD